MTLAEPLPTGLRAELVSAYEQLGRDEGREDPEVAVRGSATPRTCFTEFPVKTGIDSVSVAPDGFAVVKQHVAAAEPVRYEQGRTAPSGTRWSQAEQPSAS
ncbi:hypothetical protein [Streptomyces goshikiensis]|uniref:hypothetical protein n=1 Tax=Streptomyces goshikiensis TaxID=1942 RepID=UPI00369C03D7